MADAGDDSYSQTLLRRKIFEFLGENAPQAILQLAIELSKPDSDITSVSGLFNMIVSNLTIASSLFGLVMRSTTVYLELASKDKYGVKVEPYTCLKAKAIVMPLMLGTIFPRIFTYAVYFGSAFPLFRYDTTENGEGDK